MKEPNLAPQKDKLRVAIIEDEQNVSEPITYFINQQADMEMVAGFTSVEEFLTPASPFPHPHILLLDISLPKGMSGLQGIPAIQKKYPNIDIIMLTTASDPETIFNALRLGAISYLNKKNELKTITQTIRIVQKGGSYMSPSIARKVAELFPAQRMQSPPAQHEALTERQMDIVNGLIDGLSYKLIADRLGISVETVNDHIRRIYRKLQINSKIELINIFMKQKK